MSFFVSILLGKFLWDINAQPTMFHRDFFNTWSLPPNDFSLDLYLLLTAKLNKYEILEYPFIVYKRIAGKAKGGGSMLTKVNLTLRTLNYIYKLKMGKKF